MTAWRITHFALSDLNYSGYYLEGFRAACAAAGHEFAVSRRAPALLDAPGMEGRWRGLLYSLALFEARRGGERYFFCVDARDSARSGAAHGEGYHLPLLRHVRRYFKVNHDPAAIAADAALQPFAAVIDPADPFFALHPTHRADAFPRLLPSSPAGWNTAALQRRFKALWRLPTLDEVTRLRTVPRTCDFHHVLRYYDLPHQREHMEFRFELMRALRPLAGPGSCIGFAAAPGVLPAKYAAYRVAPRPLRAHLAALAAARVGVYVRGLHDCVSFKFGQLLALGLPVAGQTLGPGAARYATDPDLAGVPDFAAQFAHDDPVALAHAAAALAADHVRGERLGAANARIFDARFAPRPVAARMLENLGINPQA